MLLCKKILSLQYSWALVISVRWISIRLCVMQIMECGENTKTACVDTRDSVLASSAVSCLVHYCSRLSYRWNFTLVAARQIATIVWWYTLARWDRMYVQQGGTPPTFFPCCRSTSWYSPGWWIGRGGLHYWLPSCPGLNTWFCVWGWVKFLIC
jgi:hypothetical protein